MLYFLSMYKKRTFSPQPSEEAPVPRHLHQQIYDLVRQIPPGKVASYGQIARLHGGCTPRMVGFALAALPSPSDVPWQRVINAQGKISPHGFGFGSELQRQLLLSEEIQFDEQGRISFEQYGWMPI